MSYTSVSKELYYKPFLRFRRYITPVTVNVVELSVHGLQGDVTLGSDELQVFTHLLATQHIARISPYFETMYRLVVVPWFYSSGAVNVLEAWFSA